MKKSNKQKITIFGNSLNGEWESKEFETIAMAI